MKCFKLHVTPTHLVNECVEHFMASAGFFFERIDSFIHFNVSILCRPYCIKQISQSPDRLTLAYLFYT